MDVGQAALQVRSAVVDFVEGVPVIILHVDGEDGVHAVYVEIDVHGELLKGCESYGNAFTGDCVGVTELDELKARFVVVVVKRVMDLLPIGELHAPAKDFKPLGGLGSAVLAERSKLFHLQLAVGLLVVLRHVALGEDLAAGATAGLERVKRPAENSTTVNEK